MQLLKCKSEIPSITTLPSRTPRTPTPRSKGVTHQIVSGAGDEHRVITTPSGKVLTQQNRLKRQPPKFSSIMNEYVGACLEDNCNIGKKMTRWEH